MQGAPKWDASDGLMSIEEAIGRGAAFVVHVDGAAALVIAIEKTDYAFGRELCVTVAHQIGSAAGAVERVLPVIEQEFGYDCDSVCIVTRRAGLVAKLQKMDYAQAAQILRKKL